MKLASARGTTQTERLFALEEARKVDARRMDGMEAKVDEMHEILLSVRQLGRAIKWVVTWLGGPTFVAAAGVWLWRLLH